MKMTSVSTQALQSALRLQIQTSQAALAKAQQEATTGFYADTGLALGARTSSVIDLTNNVNQMQAIIDSNGLVDERLSSSQAALSQMADAAQTALDALVSITGQSDATQVGSARNQVKNAFQAFIGSVNLPANGEYLFAGTNASAKPLNDYFSDNSAAKTAFDDAFKTYFGFTQNDPATADISDSEMSAFLTDVAKPMFEDSEWQTTWSNASDQAMTSRINTNEVITSSTTANSEGIRKFALASVIGVELIGGNFSSSVTQLITKTATQTMGEAIAAINSDRSELGVAQSRVKNATDALTSQMDIVNTQIGNLTSVDRTEAITRANLLLNQIEASYSLTARIQQLSLVNYL